MLKKIQNPKSAFDRYFREADDDDYNFADIADEIPWLENKIIDFKELYIMTKSDKVSTCCFICRQVISEMFNEDAKVVCMNEKDEDEYKVRDLCVYPFLDEDLK